MLEFAGNKELGYVGNRIFRYIGNKILVYVENKDIEITGNVGPPAGERGGDAAPGAPGRWEAEGPSQWAPCCSGDRFWSPGLL